MSEFARLNQCHTLEYQLIEEKLSDLSRLLDAYEIHAGESLQNIQRNLNGR